MKVFWWQGGIHAEPETPEEGKAMRLLYDGVRRASIAAEGQNDTPKMPGCGAGPLSVPSTSSVLQELSEGVIADE